MTALARVLLYGGTFDPPHFGHLHNLAAAARLVQPDRCIVMPAGVPPHKAASGTDAALRLEMCGCFSSLSDLPGLPPFTLEISDWEIRRAARGLPNYTVDTLQMLAFRHPEAALYLSVGSDMLLHFTAWRSWQRILQLATLVCVSREQDDLDQLSAEAEKLRSCERARGVLLAQEPSLPLSSTQVRAALANGEPCSDAVPPQALRVITREGLYRASPAGKD